MREVEYIAPTKRRSMTKQRAARIFLSRNGKCWRCGVQIRGDRWTIEHPDALNLGGSDKDEDLWPVHERRCKKEKDAEDAAKIADRNSAVTQGWAGKRKSRPIPGSRGSGIRKPMNAPPYRDPNW